MVQISESQMVSSVLNDAWKFMDTLRANVPLHENVECCVYLLFCSKYRLPWKEEPSAEQKLSISEQQLDIYHELKDFVFQVVKNTDCKYHDRLFLFFDDFYNHLCAYDFDFYCKVYGDVLNQLFRISVKKSGITAGEFTQPEGLTRIVSQILRSEDVHSVYNPFAGLGSYSRGLNRECEYVGQDINRQICIFAKVLVDSRNLSHARVECTDSLAEWRQENFDAVVATPPFGLVLNHAYDLLPGDETFTHRHTVEDYLFTRAFFINHAKIAIAVVPNGFSFSKKYERLRKFLVEKDYLDTIIQLPAKAMYGTSIPAQIVICRQDRKSETPIRFIDASKCCSYSKDERINIVDAAAIFDLYQDSTNSRNLSVDKWTIQENDFSLELTRYLPVALELKDGEKIFYLGDLLTPSIASQESCTDTSKVVDSSLFSRDLISIFSNTNMSVVSTKHIVNRNKVYSSSDAYLLVMDRYGIQIALHTDGSPFVTSPNARVYTINTKVVLPEYLAYILTSDEVLREGQIRSYMSHPVVIPVDIEEQKRVISKFKQEFVANQQQEQIAMAARLGLKQNVSDLEHMLGATQLRLDSIIDRLESMTPDSVDYSTVVKSLRDNMSYMNRVIKYTGANINPDSFICAEQDLSSFLLRYSNAWRNYGGSYFDLQLHDVLNGEPAIPFDSDMLTVMLDAILSNAVRHSFHKRKNYTEHNIVRMSLSAVAYNEQPYALLSVANNGDAFARDFTLQDYISRGRFDASTGRSGLGGHHVHVIAKGHNGYLYLRQDESWNVIIDVLLPLQDFPKENVLEYGYECI